MKNIYRLLFLTLISVFCCNIVFAEKYKGEIKQTNKQSKADRCAPASGSSDLNINNVRARINTGGDMWWDFTSSKYEIPRGSSKTSMFAAALWIGGLDIDGNLKLAAQRFRSGGQDYWTGPLTTDGTADVNAETCKEYDKHFKITKKEVQDFVSNTSPNLTDYPTIVKWPAHGDVSKGQSRYLAPFFDNNNDYAYRPEDGDYPYYDLSKENVLCNSGSRNPTFESDPGSPEGITVKGGLMADQVLKGDMTLWWVFNDKGNDHTESKGASIGLEIRAQAFGFTTNDEINNMTFYTYEIINRSTYELANTYFSQWVDPDLGYAFDDYVGCDVTRGLGYCYNGRATDGAGQYYAYEGNPPAIGVDFFQGPYMDADTILRTYLDASGHPTIESVNGVGFKDSIKNNERFGMRRFVYYNNSSNSVNGEPEKAWDYYNYLRGIWKNGSKMTFGGNGTTGTVPCDFMFPGDTDPLFLGTAGTVVPGALWTEETAGNAPDDRRFMQSAGPFTLKSGAVNYITVGIPWAKAANGGPFASVKLLREVDDKCQALFDNCFKVLDGPDAPNLVVKELDRELILFISNEKGSNNIKETFSDKDIRIKETSVLTTYTKDTTYSHGDTIIHVSVPKYDTVQNDRYYRFEGYQIYQLADASVSIADIENVAKARLVKQCDLKNFDKNGNPISQLINYRKDDNLGGTLVPVEKVNGANAGISHTFRILEDQFASGDKRLVNHKKYYFIALAYAYNQYKKFDLSADGLDGQKEPYLAGRKSNQGSGEIRKITAIPHITSPESNGTKLNSVYGSTPKIKRIEGQGNGNLIIDMTQASIDELISKSSAPFIIENPIYENNKGPINVKVVDPLNVKPGSYTIKFFPGSKSDLTDATWKIYNTVNGSLSLIDTSEVNINIANEQIFTNLGLSVSIAQTKKLATTPEDVANFTAAVENIVADDGFLEASLTYTDATKEWLTGVPDMDASTVGFNWIRCGSVAAGANSSPAEVEAEDYYIKDVPSLTEPGRKQDIFLDKKEQYENVIGRTWAPYRLSSFWENGPAYNDDQSTPKKQMHPSFSKNLIMNLSSVDVVFTADKSKWTRCPVIEMGEDAALSIGHANKFELRKSPSVNKEGVADPGFDYPTGMGWFPGYAINVATGERLNIMFGEDSWLGGHNGNDMKWNPTSSYFDGNKVVFGGKHYIYIMGHNDNFETPPDPYENSPAYDKGVWAHEHLKMGMASTNSMRPVFNNVMWVSLPICFPTLTDPSKIPTDAKVRLRVAKPYARNYSTSDAGATTVQNNNYPMYQFNTDDLATQKNVTDVAQSALDLIGVVPNPYYAFSNYEVNQIDNRVRIINLPPKCTVTIYTLSGTLIRQFNVDKQGVVSGNGEALTSIDWDLKNFANIPISGGIYVIHIKSDGIGEKTIKWFGALRPTDLNSF
ncbi:MAG: hypothetical protein ACOYO1_14905 [Bacteroidales bacterium]